MKTTRYIYTALILAALSQGNAVAQNKGGFFGKVRDTFSTEIKIGNYTFKDGSVYTGEMKGRKPNGKGKTVFKNGDVYEGEYVKGKREGFGVYTFPDGERYEGQWYQDQQHGNGIYYFMNNNRYDGMWFQDYQHGPGTMYYHNGDIYVGDWVNDKREGKGTYTWRDGSKYVGDWKNDKIFAAGADCLTEQIQPVIVVWKLIRIRKSSGDQPLIQCIQEPLLNHGQVRCHGAAAFGRTDQGGCPAGLIRTALHDPATLGAADKTSQWILLWFDAAAGGRKHAL